MGGAGDAYAANVNFQAETETPWKQERFELPAVVLLRDKKPQREYPFGASNYREADGLERLGETTEHGIIVPATGEPSICLTRLPYNSSKPREGYC